MTKKLKIYQILTFALGLAFVALCLFVGITAVQKSMTLKLGLKMDPAMLCAIYVNDNLVFNNKTSEIASGVSLSANELRLNSTNTFGSYFNLKIENLNEVAINISLSGCTVGEVEGYETAILPKKDTGNIEISSAGLITITMTEAEVYYVQYNANNGGGEMATSTHIIGTSSALNANAFTAPSEDVEFAGWATTLTDAQNGVVTYEEGEVILNLGTTDGQTIQLYAVWKMKGYKVTFATNNWAATYEGEEVDSSLVVEPNGNLTVTVAGSGTQEGYSVHSSPTVTKGTVESTTFDRYTGTLTLTNIQSDLTISANDFRPWTYGKYVSTYTSDAEPAIGTIVSGTDVYYPAFDGYKYVIFANHETQENNFYISTPGDMAARWIMIGASESLDSEIFAGVTKPEGAATTTDLINSQVLLLSEYVLASMQYNTTNTQCGWGTSNMSGSEEYTGASLRHYLNNSGDSNFLALSGLSLRSEYIVSRPILTYWGGINVSSSYSDTIFILSTSSVSASNNNFMIERYFGSTYTDARYTSFEGVANTTLWLRSVRYDPDYEKHYYAHIIHKVGCSMGQPPNTVAENINNATGVRPSFVLNLA